MKIFKLLQSWGELRILPVEDSSCTWGILATGPCLYVTAIKLQKEIEFHLNHHPGKSEKAIKASMSSIKPKLKKLEKIRKTNPEYFI